MQTTKNNFNLIPGGLFKQFAVFCRCFIKSLSANCNSMTAGWIFAIRRDDQFVIDEIVGLSIPQLNNFMY